MASSENNSDEGDIAADYDHIIQIEYLKEKYRDVMSQFKTVSGEKQRLERDFQMLKKELENGKGDFFSTYHEYNMLKQKYDNLRLRYDEFVNDPSHCIKLCEELKKERNKYKELLKATELEVETVLSERGTVLKENQKLYDKNESLERELQSALRCRDESVKECSALQDKIDILKGRGEFLSHPSESNWNRERTESKDKFDMVTENLESANREIERLKKALDKAKGEITKAIQETEIAKGRRDWAISEREKIVQERDSVRNLCDEIRKERDTATSKLLAAIRDKDEAYKEIEQLTERLEAQNILKDNMNNNVTTGKQSSNPVESNFRSSRYSTVSLDSIYDLDTFQQYTIEVIEIDSSLLQNSISEWGLTISEDVEEYDNNAAVHIGPYVVSVEHDSVFAGQLLPNDIIFQINNIDCTAFSKRKIFKAMKGSLPTCTITIKRPEKRLLPIQINFVNGNKNHGLHLETGVYISKIDSNSLGAKDGRLCVGDRIISLNGKPMDCVNNMNEINAMINDMRNNSLSLIVVKDLVDYTHGTCLLNLKTKHLRSTTSCTQTDNTSNNQENNPKDSVNRLSLDLDSNNHFLPSAMHYSMNTTSSTPNSIIASTPSSSKSASKLTGMFQKLKDKMSISIHKDCQENDAIAVLDSVLDSDDQEVLSASTFTKTREKKSKRKSKDSQEVPRGTWPRVTMTVHTNESHVGTIVHRTKKERPKLSIPFDNKESNTFFTTSGSNDCNPLSPQSANNNPGMSMASFTSINKRNSNPVSKIDINRTLQSSKHSYDMNIQKSNLCPGSKSSYSRTSTYDPRNNHNNLNVNRHSLNLSSFNRQQIELQQAQQSLIDFMPVKVNNSADSSIPFPKSPIGHNYAIKTMPKDRFDVYMPSKTSKHLSKYSSDTESIDMENSPLTMTNNANTLPHSHMRKQSLGNASNASSSNRPVAATSVGNSNFPVGYSSIFPGIQTLPSNVYSHTLSSTRPSGNIIPSGEFPGHPPISHHSHGSSIDYSYNRYSQIQSSKEEVPSGLITHSYEGGTFPRNKVHQGYRIPSNQSVTSRGSGIKISNGSIDYCSSERASPIPTFQVQVLEPGRICTANKRSSLQDYNVRTKPNIGELRYVHIDKSEMSLGIKIFCRGNGGGVFVSNVGENSLASKVGLHIGDQLLEVCGINLRKATYELAAHVLRQCGNSITMLVLYNPEIYNNLTTSEDNIERSSSPTPQNSPRAIGRSIISPVNSTTVNANSTIAQKTMSNKDSHQQTGTNSSQNCQYKEQPRLIFIETRKSSNLGISLVGGNACGIFVHGVQKDSIADNAGLRVGDQILEFNAADLRRSTAEHAALEIAKPADNVTVLVLYNILRFNQIKDKPGDALYIRVGFDRNCDLGDSELSFNKDEVLYVDNTMFGGVPGRWRAWKLDEYGHKLQCGIIPNKLKVEEELRLLGDLQDVEATTRRGSTSARRSFFKRIKPQRSSSRDSKELASFSNTHLSLYVDSGSLNDDGLTSYQRVERLEYKYRPVLVLGPLSECVIEKLCIDFPEHFHRCQQNQMRCTKEDMESGVQNNAIADYRRRGSIFEYTSVQAILDNKQHHCILDVCISAVERLQRNQIYPIVLLLRFKTAKQIKEIKDSRYSADKISAKAAKEMYEHALKLESDYRQYISVVISGVNIAHMCTQIKAAVDSEQKKILWVPISTNL
ncbi:disks large homolog 5 [Toxorhynchites rutilus septentrionalis]|uniref:disks large homolog 5 n=1 Tax=Toxorhynchites rutilus septentrionalis TaxID=329112 RepID=UPI0024787DB1|nr:disks large homolog 5 [Toxorhynchites rutilus septentrionalis]XP_055640989.1 disks large homolog 5 [Toxorhynchites rutilus septentrionalis]